MCSDIPNPLRYMLALGVLSPKDKVRMDNASHVEGKQMKQELFLPDDYRPAEDEPFMNDRQKEYFKRKLTDWKQEIIQESQGTLNQLQEDTLHLPATKSLLLGSDAHWLWRANSSSCIAQKRAAPCSATHSAAACPAGAVGCSSASG